jgi:hypothetical protein
MNNLLAKQEQAKLCNSMQNCTRYKMDHKDKAQRDNPRNALDKAQGI